jgi:hypothetical protein
VSSARELMWIAPLCGVVGWLRRIQRRFLHINSLGAAMVAGWILSLDDCSFGFIRGIQDPRMSRIFPRWLVG